MPLILPGNVGSATADAGFNIDNSCRFDDDAKLTRTFGSGGSVVKWTWSSWFKVSYIGGNEQVFFSSFTDTSNFSYIKINGNNKLEFRAKTSGSTILRYTLTRRFRDPSAFMHLVVALDTTDGTAGDRIKIWINGVRETVFDASTAPAEDAVTLMNSAAAHAIGYAGDGTDYFQGYMSQVCFVDNVQYDADQFGEFDSDSGIWKPIDVSGLTFGATSFFLDFADSGDLGDDESGEGNDWTEVNIAATDSATDTPTNNFATINPLVPSQGGFTPGSATYTEGATLFTTVNASSSYSRANSTFLLTAGKWYTEIKYVNAGSIYGLIGITGSNATTTAAYLGVYAYDYAWYGNGGPSEDGNFYNNNGIVRTLGSGTVNNDILGMAIDLDNNTIQYYRNNTAVGSANAIAAPSATDFGGYVVSASEWSNSTNAVFNFNFGNPPYANSSSAADGNGFGAFEYAPPSGFLAICTKNLSKVNS